MERQAPTTDTDPIIQTLCQRLWDIGAVSFDLERGFTLADGSLSPVYFNMRLLFGHPDVRALCLERLMTLYHTLEADRIDVIAGGETAGIPLGAWLADRLNLPFIYVRKKAKGYGQSAQIEGLEHVEDNGVLLVEDLITGGGSKRVFLEGLRRGKARVEHCLVVFDRQQGGREMLADEGVQLHSVIDRDVFWDFLKTGHQGHWDALQSYFNGMWQPHVKEEGRKG